MPGFSHGARDLNLDPHVFTENSVTHGANSHHSPLTLNTLLHLLLPATRNDMLLVYIFVYNNIFVIVYSLCQLYKSNLSSPFLHIKKIFNFLFQ